MKYLKISLIILIVLTVSGTAFGILHSLYYESPPVYRPMVFYDGKLFWDIGTADIDNAEYVGTIKSRVPESQKPTKELECNCDFFMNARLYRDDYGNYYICCTDGDLLLLETSGAGRDTHITPKSKT